MDRMIAYCGLDCSGCPIYLATLETDGKKRRELRLSVVRLCRGVYGMDLTIEDVTDCDGCRQNARLFRPCWKCEIRRCAEGRELQSCAFCPDYACELLEEHLEMDPGARSRLETLRAAG
jgi:hypothetical protein